MTYVIRYPTIKFKKPVAKNNGLGGGGGGGWHCSFCLFLNFRCSSFSSVFFFFFDPASNCFRNHWFGSHRSCQILKNRTGLSVTQAQDQIAVILARWRVKGILLQAAREKFKSAKTNFEEWKLINSGQVVVNITMPV